MQLLKTLDLSTLTILENRWHQIPLEGGWGEGVKDCTWRIGRNNLQLLKMASRGASHPQVKQPTGVCFRNLLDEKEPVIGA